MRIKKHFPGQLPDEVIFTVLHRHWFNIFSHFVIIILFFLAALFFFFFGPVVFDLLGVNVGAAFVPFLTTLTLLFLWVYAFFIWIDYYFDVWIITNERLLNIEQKGLFTRDISEVRLARIQDIKTSVKGFFPTVLNYGDIFVQTAGEEKNFHFRNVGDPDEQKDEMMRLLKKASSSSNASFPQEETKIL